MHLLADDSVNRSIWTESGLLQRRIVEHQSLPLLVGAQQAMPKDCDQDRFSPQDPLPWVPDLVGNQFGASLQSVLVVASSYNGFIDGYSGRGAVMALDEYVEAKSGGVDRLDWFLSRFKQCVVDGDEDYYQPILRDLLAAAGCYPDRCCITDLCKASFVQRGRRPESGNRGDEGSDSVVRNNWQQWVPYIAGLAEGASAPPLPYQWLWSRMQQCRVIIALGTIAEYGVLKIFHRMASAPKVWSWKNNNVAPDHPTMTRQVPDWEYGYASRQRKLGDWLSDEDWWVVGDPESTPRWFLLPVHHPASAIGRGNDAKYRKTIPRLRRMMEQAAATQ